MLKLIYMKKIIAIIVLIVVCLAVYLLLPQRISPNKIEDMPQEQSQGKININEVCEGALIRMTFPDGEAAAKFVEDCKAGKHPEVIEQFKAELNLGAGVEI
jgi:hypothetical protein